MTKYLNFFESGSGFTEAVEAGELFYPNVSYTEDDDTVHWNLTQPVNPVETPMLRMSFGTSSSGQEVKLRKDYTYGITAMEIDGTPVNYASTYNIAEPGNHTAVYQFASPAIPLNAFSSDSILNAFTAFTSAEITSPVTAVGNNAFRFCTALTSVTIPNSVTTIGHESFSNCSGLTSVTIPNSVTTIGVNAFSATRLRRVTVPNSVIAMSSGVFKHCTVMLTAGIGSGITTIPPETFYGCTSLDYVVLPGNLTVIGEEAFFGCSSLRAFNKIPSGVTRIGERAFSGCSSLQSVTLPDSITTFGIGEDAFNGCSGLTAIYLNPETPPTLGAGALDNTNDCPIYVPAGSVDTYKEAWPEYASRIMPKYNITATVSPEGLGDVNVKESAYEGDTVNFSVVASDLQYQVTAVSITDGNGDEVEYEGDDNYYTFTMPASDVTISVTIGEKPKYTVTVDSTEGFAENIEFMNSEDGTFNEGDHVNFTFMLQVPEIMQVASVQASDCDGNSIEVEVEDQGDGFYYCYFTMPSCDASIFITVGEKPETNYTVTVNSTDDLVTDVALINEETGDWDWDYEGELSFKKGEAVDFAFRVPDGYQAVSAEASDSDGNFETGVELNDLGDGMYECFFEIPEFFNYDITVFVTVE